MKIILQKLPPLCEPPRPTFFTNSFIKSEKTTLGFCYDVDFGQKKGRSLREERPSEVAMCYVKNKHNTHRISINRVLEFFALFKLIDEIN
jgi:hypothetical protein